MIKSCIELPLEGRFQWNVSNKDAMLCNFTRLLLKGNPATRLVEMDIEHMVLLKIMNECFFQKGGGADQPNSDHKLVL